MAQEHEIKIIVLKMNVDEVGAMALMEQKKTNQFGSLLSRVKKEDIIIQDVKFYYEAMLKISSRYTADYYAMRKHTISVDSNVQDVIIGEKVFSVNEKSKFKKMLVRNSKNKISFQAEEHVFVDETSTLTFNHHGEKIKFPYKLKNEVIERYPDIKLETNETKIRDIKLSYDTAVEKAEHDLKSLITDDDIYNIQEEFTVQEIIKIYVPIFEARLVGPKKETIIRIDATRKKAI